MRQAVEFRGRGKRTVCKGCSYIKKKKPTKNERNLKKWILSLHFEQNYKQLLHKSWFWSPAYSVFVIFNSKTGFLKLFQSFSLDILLIFSPVLHPVKAHNTGLWIIQALNSHPTQGIILCFVLIAVNFKLYLWGLCYQQPVPKTHIVFHFIYLNLQKTQNKTVWQP